MKEINHLVIAKIAALWKALKLCVELNFPNIVFEEGAHVVTKAINNKREN